MSPSLGALCLVLAGVLLGWWLTRRHHPRLRPGRCECGHPRCMHHEGVDVCSAQWMIKTRHAPAVLLPVLHRRPGHGRGRPRDLRAVEDGRNPGGNAVMGKLIAGAIAVGILVWLVHLAGTFAGVVLSGAFQ
jgi:hypothetical protein